MSNSPSLVWFRQDLRLADNPALLAATKRDGPVIPVFIWAPGEEGNWPPGAASRWWLHHSLDQLDVSLRKHRSRIVIREGASLDVLDELIRDTTAGAVFWNRRYEPAAPERDRKVEAKLREMGVEGRSFDDSLLFDPDVIKTKAGSPYKVFTPFWKCCLDQPEPPAPSRAPKNIKAPKSWPKSTPLKALQLLAEFDRAEGLRETWEPGEAGATRRLKRFLDRALGDYDTNRELPAIEGTSRLSPHLHFGEISPRQVWHAAQRRMARSRSKSLRTNADAYLRQLGWREFSYYLLYHFPHVADEPLRPEFANFPWREDEGALRAWQRGRTGYPIVDAGMRQLWRTGWMHNRVRMIVASFLVKDLLLPWRAGATWFWDTLVDADLANNTMGWQWTAGCGADAAPFFRIFNPVSQGERFDPKGEYVRRWVPELASLPDRYVHKPWETPASVLSNAGVALGESYPAPIVNHRTARVRALAALKRMK